MTYHGRVTSNQGIHTPFAWIFSDAAARVAFTPTAGAPLVSAGLTAADVHRVALQVDDGSQWRLVTHSPVAWAQTGGSSGGAHAESHASDGDDPVTIETSQVTGLDTALSDEESTRAAADQILETALGVLSPSIVQLAYLKASVNVAGAGFGLHVAVDGDTLVVGAYAETGGGAAYVYRRIDGVFEFWQRLTASNAGSGDQFGVRVAVSGNRIAVGANLEDGSGTGINPAQNDLAANAGAVYIFTESSDVWAETAYIKASNAQAGDQFGFDVALDGDTLVVGAPIEASNATGINGDQSNNSSVQAGAVYVIVIDEDDIWTQQAYIKSSNTQVAPWNNYNFGIAVAISGDTIVVGQSGDFASATGVGAAQTPTVSNNSAGSAIVFTRTLGVWSQQVYIRPPVNGQGDGFGADVSLDGDLLVINAPNEDGGVAGVNGDQTDNSVTNSGCAHLLRRTAGVWAFIAYLKSSNPVSGNQFGFDTTVRGDTVVITCPLDDSDSTGVHGDQPNIRALQSGAVHVFRVIENTVTQVAYLKASNTGDSDVFGRSVALDGSMLIVGAHAEDSNGTGVDPDTQADNSSLTSGAAYVFELGRVVTDTDPRLFNARVPTAHSASHTAAGTDPLTLTSDNVTDESSLGAGTVTAAINVLAARANGVEYRGLRGMNATNHYDMASGGICGNNTGWETIIAFILDTTPALDNSNQYLVSSGSIFGSGYHIGWNGTGLRVYWHDDAFNLGGYSGVFNSRGAKMLLVLGVSYTGTHCRITAGNSQLQEFAFTGFAEAGSIRIGSQVNGDNPLIDGVSLIALGHKSNGLLTAAAWEAQMRALLTTGDFIDGTLTSRYSFRDLAVGAAPATIEDEIGANDWTLTGSLSVVQDNHAGFAVLT